MYRQYSPHASRFAAGNMETARLLPRFAGVSESGSAGLSRYRIHQYVLIGVHLSFSVICIYLR